LKKEAAEKEEKKELDAKVHSPEIMKAIKAGSVDEEGRAKSVSKP